LPRRGKVAQLVSAEELSPTPKGGPVLIGTLNPSSGAYQAVEALHILAVVVGFGGVLLNGVYAQQGRKKGGAEWAAVSEVNEFVSRKVALMAIYLVPLLGFALIGMSDKVYKFSQVWVSVSLVLYIVIVGVAHAVLFPSHRKISVLLRAGSPPVSEIDALEKRIGIASGANSLMLVAILFLMVVKPT
jgi:uncharacterized membrane protein